MDTLNIWDSDYKFMTIVWDNAPVGSGELVKLCEAGLGWKKSTTYNAIRRMCEKGIIRSDNAVISVVVPKEKVQMMQSDSFLERTFDGSLPQFLAAFLSGRAISKEEADEIQRLIDAHKEK